VGRRQLIENGGIPGFFAESIRLMLDANWKLIQGLKKFSWVGDRNDPPD
jgi:hypothetical protein